MFIVTRGGVICDVFTFQYNNLKYSFIYSLFQEYKTCSGPYFINCDEDTLTEFHILDSAFTPICGHLEHVLYS
jgi:hypothetical protein